MWVSFHVYCGGSLYGATMDRLLVDVVTPLLDRLRDGGQVVSSFYIRYADPRSHVRLRMVPAEGVEPEALLAELEEAVAAFDGRGGGAGDEEVTVKRMAYEPETERYGGAEALSLAEDHFDLSSRVALRLVSRTLGPGRPRRLGKAVLSSVLLIFCWCRDRDVTARFLAGYAERYRHYLVPEAEAGLGLEERLAELGLCADGDTLASMTRALHALVTAAQAEQGLGVPLLDVWMEGVSITLDGLRALHHQGALHARPGLEPSQALEPIVGSYLHMHHNRLGLSIPQEIYVAHLAARALSAPEEGS